MGDVLDEVVDALDSLDEPEVVEVYNMWVDATGMGAKVYQMDEFDEVVGEESYSKVMKMVSQSNHFDFDDFYFTWDEDSAISSMNDVSDELVAEYGGDIAQYIIDNDNPTSIMSVDEILYPE